MKGFGCSGWTEKALLGKRIYPDLTRRQIHHLADLVYQWMAGLDQGLGDEDVATQCPHRPPESSPRSSDPNHSLNRIAQLLRASKAES